MAITHTIPTRNALAALVRDLIDAGPGPGVLVFLASNDTPVATCTLSDPSAGVAEEGTITFNAIADDTDAAGGTVSKFELRTSAGAVVLEGTVTTTGGGGDIEMSAVAIGAGSNVSVTSLTYTASL